MKQLKTVFYCVCIILIAALSALGVNAVKIGAGPQEIILEKASGRFSVFNPNPEDVQFQIEGDAGMFFNQTKGTIKANSKKDIALTSFDGGNILIRFLYDNLEPGVGLKVRKPAIPNYGIWIFVIILFLGVIVLEAILFCFSI